MTYVAIAKKLGVTTANLHTQMKTRIEIINFTYCNCDIKIKDTFRQRNDRQNHINLGLFLFWNTNGCTSVKTS